MKLVVALLTCSLLLGLADEGIAQDRAKELRIPSPQDLDDFMTAYPKYYLARQLEENCFNGLSWKQEYCETYAMGVIDGLDQAYIDLSMKPDFCLPREFNGTDILNTMRNHEPVTLMEGETAASLVHRVLRRSFPCPNNSKH